MMLTGDKPSGLITELGVLGLSSALSLFWKLIKLFIFSCIIIGSVKAITAGIESPPYLFSDGVYIGLWRIADTLTDHWLYLLLLSLFIWAFSLRQTISKIQSDTLQTKIAVVSMCNYLNIQVETDGMRHTKAKGVWSFLKETLLLGTLDKVFGTNTTDDALTAKAVRDGKTVSLRSDLEQ